MSAVVGQKNWQSQELIRVVGEDEDISAYVDIEIFREGRNLRTRGIAAAVAGQNKCLTVL